jgi:hypothetical protein
MGLLAPDPIVVVVPHFLMMFESSETLFILSTLILLVIINFEIYTLLLLYLNRHLLHLKQELNYLGHLRHHLC